MPTPRTKLGSWGEEQASQFLQDKGYQILTTNYRSSYGEVDIVAQDGNELVFVEVRTRRSEKFGAPEESLSKAKVQRLVNTCQDYLQNTAREDTSWRLDLVCLYLGQGRQVRRIQHLEHAVQL